jgi:hypothetical protein
MAEQLRRAAALAGAHARHPHADRRRGLDDGARQSATRVGGDDVGVPACRSGQASAADEGSVLALAVRSALEFESAAVAAFQSIAGTRGGQD